MEMGKLTAKLRDAVPVCLLVEGKEIKRYKNIDIPDELKKLEYQAFQFDVPLIGNITFKIMFAPGVLPEIFPLARDRKTRKPLTQESQPQESATAEEMAETQFRQEPLIQDKLATMGFPKSVVEAFEQVPEDVKAIDEPMEIMASAMEHGEITKAEFIGDEPTGRVLMITMELEEVETSVEAESAEDKAQPKDGEPTKKLARKGKGKKDTAFIAE